MIWREGAHSVIDQNLIIVLYMQEWMKHTSANSVILYLRDLKYHLSIADTSTSAYNEQNSWGNMEKWCVGKVGYEKVIEHDKVELYLLKYEI